MATAAGILARLDELLAAPWSGAASVRYPDGTEVRFESRAQLLEARRQLVAESRSDEAGGFVKTVRRSE